MTTTEKNKPGGKSGRRSRKGERAKKADAQRLVEIQPIEQAVPVEMKSTEPGQLPHAKPNHAPIAEPALVEPIEAVAAPPAPADAVPVSLQTIANAYRDYTRKSLAEIGSYFEQLTGVRSLDGAMTVQSEFLKRAYETSVAESQKICELHNRLARQTLQPFQELANKGPGTRGKS
jgi:Phasin protein